MYYETILTVPQADALFTPPSSYSPQKTLARLDLRLDTHSDDSLDADIFNMLGSGSPQPYIKEEVEDMQFNSGRFSNHNGFDMNQQFNNPQFSSAHEGGSAIDPSNLTMSGSMNINNQFGSTSYVHGAANIADDELADSLGFPNGYGQDNLNQPDFFHSNSNAANMNQMYSNTPDDLPIQSPFVHPGGFDFNQYQSGPPRMGYTNSMQANSMRHRMAMSRTGSDSRAPMSPKTPAMASRSGANPRRQRSRAYATSSASPPRQVDSRFGTRTVRRLRPELRR